MALLKSLDIGQLDKNCFYSGDWKGYTNDNIIVEDPDLVYYDLNKLQEVSRGFPYNDEGLQDFFFIASSEYMLNGFSNIFLELPNLIKKYEASNHLIALGKLKEDKKINEHQRVLKFREDYYLTRWL
ncbi:hypothetical protein KO529_08920 [Arenibacter algicola]|uniref:hypothetical protein n=1 Tax=Arenibacter algicola TaxID=616991 RepID=UPI001C06BB81|nr:hypothetical protein [Arenibacter algicola]MBU2904902.1 hypothetical protein [Arenibacter algicola]